VAPTPGASVITARQRNQDSLQHQKNSSVFQILNILINASNILFAALLRDADQTNFHLQKTAEAFRRYPLFNR